MTDRERWEVSIHEESMMQAEIHFLKNQQWNVTNYALLIFGALISLRLLGNPARVLPTCVLLAVAMISAAAAVFLIWLLEGKLNEARARAQEERAKLPLKLYNERRSPAVLSFLNAALVLAGVLTTWILGAHLCVVVGFATAILLWSALQWDCTVRATR